MQNIISSLFSIIFMLVMTALGGYVFLQIVRSTLKLSVPSQEMVVGRIDPERGTIAANPLLLMSRTSLIVSTFLLGVAMLVGILQLFSLVVLHQWFFWEWAFLFAVLLLAAWMVRMSSWLRFLWRVEPIRFSLAAKGSANTAPVLFSSRSLKPLSLTLRLIPFSIVRTTIEAKEYGLKMDTGKFMHWHEARLFACYQLPAILPGGSSTTVYELSSSGSVITWRWLHNSQSPFAIWTPLLPTAEYNRQMQMLCDLVTENTGLPLNDLTSILDAEEALSKQ